MLVTANTQVGSHLVLYRPYDFTNGLTGWSWADRELAVASRYAVAVNNGQESGPAEVWGAYGWRSEKKEPQSRVERGIVVLASRAV